MNLFGKSNFKINISEIVVGFVRWILILVFMIIAADVMQWSIISVEISNLCYLPLLFSITLFMIGIYVANFVRKAIYGLFSFKYEW
jgi:cytochrome c oxidase subunit IV